MVGGAAVNLNKTKSFSSDLISKYRKDSLNNTPPKLGNSFREQPLKKDDQPKVKEAINKYSKEVNKDESFNILLAKDAELKSKLTRAQSCREQTSTSYNEKVVVVLD